MRHRPLASSIEHMGTHDRGPLPGLLGGQDRLESSGAAIVGQRYSPRSRGPNARRSGLCTTCSSHGGNTQDDRAVDLVRTAAVGQFQHDQQALLQWTQTALSTSATLRRERQENHMAVDAVLTQQGQTSEAGAQLALEHGVGRMFGPTGVGGHCGRTPGLKTARRRRGRHGGAARRRGRRRWPAKNSVFVQGAVRNLLELAQALGERRARSGSSAWCDGILPVSPQYEAVPMRTKSRVRGAGATEIAANDLDARRARQVLGHRASVHQ